MTMDFDEYMQQGEPGRQERAYAWRTAIGLQAVDGLTPSDYLKDTARRHIEGEISIDEARSLIDAYYLSKTGREPDEDGKQEADKVSANITKVLSTHTLDFSTKGYMAVHRRIFAGVFKHAGQMRRYDISKKELVAHVTKFVSNLWQIHPFCEGNTRTTAVFLIQYLRSIGFRVDNDLFAGHSWYFRNALVRANYKNAQKGIDYCPVYLERFFRNLLLGEHWDLRNRYLHIHPAPEWREQPRLDDGTSAVQARCKYGTSTMQVEAATPSPYVLKLIMVLGKEQMAVKVLMERLQLRGRANFMNLYLVPAIQAGFVTLLYPDKPRHPRQEYMLSGKGRAVYEEMQR